MVGGSPAMARLADLCQVAGDHTCTVLINGESGTGKEMVARSIHASGPRASRISRTTSRRSPTSSAC
jgi:DNA-binding NtrC family response regulator